MRATIRRYTRLRFIFLCVCLASLLFLSTQISEAARTKVSPFPPDAYFDVRAREDGVTPRSATRSSLDRLAGRKSQVVNELDPLTGTVASLTRWQGDLSSTLKGPLKKAVKGWVQDNYRLLGIDRNDIPTLKLTSIESLSDGDKKFIWTQKYLSIPAYDNQLTVYTQNRRVSAVGGSPNRSLNISTATPKISATNALEIVNKSISGVSHKNFQILSRQDDPQRSTKFSDGSSASLVIFNLGTGKSVLAWEIAYSPNTPSSVSAVVDAQSGRLLRRFSAIKAANANVWDFYPGAPTGGTQRIVDITKWLTDNSGFLRNNNYRVSAILSDETITIPYSYFSQDNDFISQRTPFALTFMQCPIAGCSWDSSTPYSWRRNLNQTLVQIFYFLNQFHDYLSAPPINYTTKLTGPKRINAVLDLTGIPDDDGIPKHLNNAIASAIWDRGATIEVDSIKLSFYLNGVREKSLPNTFTGESATTVFHELSHAFVDQANPSFSTTQSPQATALQEALADWYSTDFILKHGYQTDTVNPGEIQYESYADNGLNLIRSQPLDCTAGAPTSVCPRNRTSQGLSGQGGYTYDNFGKINLTLNDEPHSNGEIMAETLLDLRRKVVETLGESDGVRTTEALITEAIRRISSDYDFLAFRNAILVANTNSKLEPIIWQVFAERGMGGDAQEGRLTDPETEARDPLKPIAGFRNGPLPKPGTLDKQFGRNGKIEFQYKDASGKPIPTHAEDIAIQPDGKAIVVGASGSDLMLWRISPDGKPDTTFNATGNVRWSAQLNGDLPSQAATGKAVAMDSNGKIVVSGAVGLTLSLWRFNTDGSLDKTFNGDGYFNQQYADGKQQLNSIGNDVAVSKDKIFVAGSIGDSISLWKLNSSGQLDTKFGKKGTLKYSSRSGGKTFANSLLVNKDGKTIFSTGYAQDNFGSQVITLAHTIKGKPDLGYLREGELLKRFTTDRILPSSGIAIDRYKQKFVVLGKVANHFGVWRFDNEGQDDTYFPIEIMDELNDDPLNGNDLFVQSNGKMVVVGSIENDLALWRLNYNGTIDLSFGSSGDMTRLEYNAPDESHAPLKASGNSIVSQDKNLLVAGSIGNSMAVWRLHNSSN